MPKIKTNNPNPSKYLNNPLVAPVIHYHNRVISTFDELPSKGKLKEVAIRIAVLIVIPLAYLALGILALIGLCLEKCKANKITHASSSVINPVGNKTPIVPPPVIQPKPELPISFKSASLESEFEDLIFSDFDVHKFGFADYLYPNEAHPEGIKAHLDQAEPGIILSTGTERSFFDLLFSDSQKCDGLVIRDLNPRVKAYVDFNILLLKISESFEEYRQLSASIPSTGAIKPESLSIKDKKSMKKRIKLITKKTKSSNLSEKEKTYYLKHMNDFGGIYLEWSSWKKDSYCGDAFEAANYYNDAAKFQKLQTYAKAGRIISTIGDINDLRFLKNRKIAVVDTSNINYYAFINLKGEGDFHPRIVWTTQFTSIPTDYYSIPYSEVCNDEEKKEFDELMNKRFGPEPAAIRVHNLIDTLAYTKKGLKVLRSGVG